MSECFNWKGILQKRCCWVGFGGIFPSRSSLAKKYIFWGEEMLGVHFSNITAVFFATSNSLSCAVESGLMSVGRSWTGEKLKYRTYKLHRMIGTFLLIQRPGTAAPCGFGSIYGQFFPLQAFPYLPLVINQKSRVPTKVSHARVTKTSHILLLDGIWCCEHKSTLWCTGVSLWNEATGLQNKAMHQKNELDPIRGGMDFATKPPAGDLVIF